MSVPVQTPYKKYTAAPGATVFPTTFRVVLAGDLQVRVNAVVVTSGFTLSALGLSAGLDVTFSTPMVGGEIVELQRIIPKSRVTDYQQLGNFNSTTVNADIDRTWMSIQELGEEIDRSVKVPIGSSIDPAVLIADLEAASAAAVAAAATADTDAAAAAASAAAAAASAASTGLPVSLVGKLLNFLRVKADESGYEHRTAAQLRSDIGAAKAGADDTITSLSGVTTINGANVGFVPVRQTVLSGPVDSNGQSAFGGSTGSTTVTAAGTLIATAANGFVAAGQQNRTGSIVNPSWTGLSTNGTMFLYLDINADGTCTTGSGTLAPVYQPGGTYSTTANQFTFNYAEMVGKVGNGSAAAQTYRVYVGEVTVAGGVVTAIAWYALNRRFTSAWTATLPAAATQVSANHNLGTQEFIAQFEAECTTADVGFSVGDRVDLLVAGLAGTNVYPMGIRKQRLSLSIQTASGSAQQFLIPDGTTGNGTSLTNARWKYRFVCLPKF